VQIAIIDDLSGGRRVLTVKEMAAEAPLRLSLSERVPGIEGEAFDLKSWWRARRTEQEREREEPTHLIVEAADEFQAVIPWGELDQAVLLYAVNDEPLKKGYPIRLYVPDGSSACLNVKSIVQIRFAFDHSLGTEARFGFKNEITSDELLHNSRTFKNEK
jgi:hypothetical protein